MRNYLLLILFLPLMGFAQDGVHFIENIPWEKVTAMAKAQHKMIFVDCYATYCIPCKIIDKAVFQDKLAGDYFNKHFISYKVQMDTAKSDRPEKVRFYPEAKKVQQLAEVVNFPTYAFFSPEGKILHRFVGGTQDPKAFIEMAGAAFDSNRQFYTLKQQLEENGNPDSQLLKRSALAYQRNADYKNGYDEKSRNIASAYVRKCSVEELLTGENLEFIRGFTSRTTHSGFLFFLNHDKEIDAILGEGMAADLIERCVFHSLVNPTISSADQPDWNKLEKTLADSYPRYSSLFIRKAKMSYYAKNENWSTYIKVVNELISSKAAAKVMDDLPAYAFEVYMHTKDKTNLKEISRWTALSLSKQPVTDDKLIIHGSILYALGDKKNALLNLEKAKSLAKDPEKFQYISATIKKVRNNIPLL